MARGRKKQQQPEAAANGDDRRNELSDEQRQALALQWKRKLIAAVDAKNEAVAEVRNVRKQIKADLGVDGVDLVEDMIALETEKGEAKIRAAIERQLRAARWMAVPMGQQAELFTDFTDPRPATERAFEEGRKAGMEGAERKPPYDSTLPQFDQWMEGYAAGQKAIFAIQKAQDGALFEGAAEERKKPNRNGSEAVRPIFEDDGEAEEAAAAAAP